MIEDKKQKQIIKYLNVQSLKQFGTYYSILPKPKREEVMNGIKTLQLKRLALTKKRK